MTNFELPAACDVRSQLQLAPFLVHCEVVAALGVPEQRVGVLRLREKIVHQRDRRAGGDQRAVSRRYITTPPHPQRFLHSEDPTMRCQGASADSRGRQSLAEVGSRLQGRRGA